MNESVRLPPDLEYRIQELLQIPGAERAAIAYRLLDSLYLSDLPDNRELRGEAEREDLKQRLAIQVRRVLQQSAAWNNPPPDPSRIDETRGSPRIRGTRITVHTIIDYLKHGWTHTQIAFLFSGVMPEDVLAAADYIGRNLDAMVAEYQSIIDRHRNYKPPLNLEEKLAGSRERLLALRERLRREAESKSEPEEVHAGDPV
jgi:uncharacterized protein (DUF433 family)